MTELCSGCQVDGTQAPPWPNPRCLRCAMRLEDAVAKQLADLKQKLAASERENAAWRELADLADCDDLPLRVYHIDETARVVTFMHSQSVNGCGSTVQAAAIDLATKLGLLDKAGG